MMKRKKTVKTPDDFYPTRDGTVSVSLHRDKGIGVQNWRVAVWGDDDFGLERSGMDIDEAFRVFRSITDGLTIRKLKQLGFVAA